jgi:Undecaprenyl-phosphate galactose phosphotransferase WbaP
MPLERLDLPEIMENNPQVFPLRGSIKRLLDVLIASLMCIAAMPLFLGIAAALKLTSPGPIFYRQTRIGQGGRYFHIYKFRTMEVDADKKLAHYLDTHPHLRQEWELNHKLENDPRITWIGKFLRKTSLDELPQLLNVVHGDMSFVGPRPIVDSEVHKYGDSFDLYKQVQPGITGLWQVYGRNKTTYTRRVQLDEYYVQNWSLMLDFYILFRTLKTVVLREGAS